MAEWYQVYSDDAVLRVAHRGARRVILAFALLSGVLVAAAPVAAVAWPGQAGAVVLLCGGGLSAYAVWAIRRLAALYRRVWRLDLSVQGAVAHGAGGRRTSMAWAALDRVDVSDAGLTLRGHDDAGRPADLFVAASMPEFAALSHRAVEYAEAFRRTVCVDGRPWESIDLSALYPSIRPASAPPS